MKLDFLYESLLKLQKLMWTCSVGGLENCIVKMKTKKLKENPVLHCELTCIEDIYSMPNRSLIELHNTERDV